MSGGLLQLVAFGTADIHLVSQPQITYWRYIWRRHTNHAVEATLMTPHGSFQFNHKTSVTISRTADLVNKCYLEVELPALQPLYNPAAPTQTNIWKQYNNQNLPWSAIFPSAGVSDDEYYMDWVQDVGFALIKSVELEIGGTRIDRLTSEYMHIWSALTVPPQKRQAFNKMIGHKEYPVDHPERKRRGYSTKEPLRLYIPLMFFFNEYGLSLPLIAISYHDIKLNFELRSAQELLMPPKWLSDKLSKKFEDNGVPGGPKPFIMPDDVYFKMVSCNLYADMVHLDQAERRRVAKMPHELLVTTVQFLGDEIVTDATPGSGAKWALNFSHPVKELLWVFVKDGGGVFEYEDIFDEIQLQMNGHMRMSPRKASYFTLVQPYQHHTTTPDLPIHCFSFGLHPESPQPSGQMNFSRLDQANLIGTFKMTPGLTTFSGRLKVMAIGYNLLRVSNGMAALAYTS